MTSPRKKPFFSHAGGPIHPSAMSTTTTSPYVPPLITHHPSISHLSCTSFGSSPYVPLLITHHITHHTLITHLSCTSFGSLHLFIPPCFNLFRHPFVFSSFIPPPLLSTSRTNRCAEVREVRNEEASGKKGLRRATFLPPPLSFAAVLLPPTERRSYPSFLTHHLLASSVDHVSPLVHTCGPVSRTRLRLF
jgi:hypothetical protein